MPSMQQHYVVSKGRYFSKSLDLIVSSLFTNTNFYPFSFALNFNHGERRSSHGRCRRRSARQRGARLLAQILHHGNGGLHIILVIVFQVRTPPPFLSFFAYCHADSEPSSDPRASSSPIRASYETSLRVPTDTTRPCSPKNKTKPRPA